MKMNYYLICLILTAISITGCASNTRRDAYFGQPYSTNGKPTMGFIESKPADGIDLSGKSRYISNFFWKAYKEEKVYMEEVIQKCEDFLKKQGFVDAPHEIEIPRDNAYPWSLVDSSLNALRKRVNQDRIIGYDYIKTIVCIDPIIVIITKGRIQHFDQPQQFVPRNHEYVKGYWIPSNGYAYGPVMPYDSNPKWFSPDLAIAPSNISINEDGVRIIPVEWGFLLLNKNRDQWLVQVKK